MKVICKKNTSKDFDLKEVLTIYRNDIEYHLEIGKEYIVMGIKIPKNSLCLYYLINHSSRPRWYPYLLFEVSDNSLPDGWYANVYDKKTTAGDIFYLSGFYELCNDENFYDALMDRDHDAMRTYFRRKIEFENKIKDSL